MIPPWYDNASFAYDHVIESIKSTGRTVSPRGQDTLEAPHNSVAFDMSFPVCENPARGISYKFMAAEALWITDGDNSLEGIFPWNKAMAKFSDDGVVLHGAYGPPFVDQLGYIVRSLNDDVFTRQACLTIWRQRPYPSKDIPCTIAMVFDIRGGRLNCHVFMRSSDAFLGIPYDFFSFTMMALRVACETNRVAHEGGRPLPICDLGTMYWTGCSSHIYARNEERVAGFFGQGETTLRPIDPHPMREGDWGFYKNRLLNSRAGDYKPDFGPASFVR